MLEVVADSILGGSAHVHLCGQKSALHKGASLPRVREASVAAQILLAE
jgi:hypothetical protein